MASDHASLRRYAGRPSASSAVCYGAAERDAITALRTPSRPVAASVSRKRFFLRLATGPPERIEKHCPVSRQRAFRMSPRRYRGFASTPTAPLPIAYSHRMPTRSRLRTFWPSTNQLTHLRPRKPGKHLESPSAWQGEPITPPVSWPVEIPRKPGSRRLRLRWRSARGARSDR